jgi:ornithine carbamoyltransferase
MIADMMTIKERFGYLKGLKLVFCGDARNNVANSLMVVCAKLGLHYVACGPKDMWPAQTLIDTCQKIAKDTGAVIECLDDKIQATTGANVIYTDV